MKCSPLRERGKPTDQMWQRCPPRYLAAELEILQPGVIVTMGGDPRWALGQVGEIDYAIDRPLYRRGRIRTVGGLRSTLVGVPHPSAWGQSRWALGQAELVADLAADPLR